MYTQNNELVRKKVKKKIVLTVDTLNSESVAKLFSNLHKFILNI